MGYEDEKEWKEVPICEFLTKNLILKSFQVQMEEIPQAGCLIDNWEKKVRNEWLIWNKNQKKGQERIQRTLYIEEISDNSPTVVGMDPFKFWREKFLKKK